MKVYFKTFGCRLNRAEALGEEAEYIAGGWESVDSADKADLAIVRCCSVTGRAERESKNYIERLRQKHPQIRVIAAGCLPQPLKIRLSTPLPPAFRLDRSTPDSAIPLKTARAYLKAQDGCNGKCTFCTIPKFRGHSVSTDFGECLDRARRFIDAGYREIVLTGCNLSLYASAGKRLPELIGALADLDGACRLRIGSLEPGICDSEVLHAMASRRNICRSLHIPVQSGSDRILLAMRRPYLTRDINRLADTAVRLMSDISLGCDLIAGFPDETELDFYATKSLLKRLPFSNAHIFPYSERPGTMAATFPGAIDRHVRSLRAHSLQRTAEENRRKFARRFVGKTVEVLIENEKNSSGWTSQYLWFEAASGAGAFPRRSLARFRVTGAQNGILQGEIADK